MRDNWREMFEQNRREPSADGVPPPQREPDEGELDVPSLDLTEYKPWVLQRGRGRPALMLDLRRFEEKSGLWVGWQVSYPNLIAVEYIGDKMLSLDFGLRQFMIEGQGLDELTRYLQQGSVLAIQEYAPKIWINSGDGPLVRSITKLGAS